MFWTKIKNWAGLPLLMAFWPINSGSPAKNYELRKTWKIKIPKNATSVFTKKLSIAPAAHGIMANNSGITMRNKNKVNISLNKTNLLNVFVNKK